MSETHLDLMKIIFCKSTAVQSTAQKEALKNWMEQKSREFAEAGDEPYSKA
jgi:hypothetical protein